MGWYHGSVDVDPMTVEAGSITGIVVELDWSRPNVTKDFSVIVHGTGGPLSLRHVSPQGKTDSDSFATIERR